MTNITRSRPLLFFQDISLFIHLFIYVLSIYLFIYLFMYVCIYLSIDFLIYLFALDWIPPQLWEGLGRSPTPPRLSIYEPSRVGDGDGDGYMGRDSRGGQSMPAPSILYSCDPVHTNPWGQHSRWPRLEVLIHFSNANYRPSFSLPLLSFSLSLFVSPKLTAPR